MLSIHLFTFHPLLQTEFARLLPPSEFEVATDRLEHFQNDSDEAPVSPASVYVLEASGNEPLTESLVEKLVRRRAAPLVVVAERFEQTTTFPLLALGVKGLLRYVDLETFLARALREVERGGFWVPRHILSRFVDLTLSAGRPRTIRSPAVLSPREREVVELLLENLPNKEIADRLRISERTAKFHVSNLLAKYGVKRRADLILLSVAPKVD